MTCSITVIEHQPIFELRGYAVWELVHEDANGQRWIKRAPDIRELLACANTKPPIPPMSDRPSRF